MDLEAFHREIIAKNIDAANHFDKVTRKGYARDIFMTYLQIEAKCSADNRPEKLKSYLSDIVAKRHKLVQTRASSREDPLWNVFACMESVVKLEYMTTQDEDVESIANEVKKELSAFVDENLPLTEMQELQALVLNSPK